MAVASGRRRAGGIGQASSAVGTHGDRRRSRIPLRVYFYSI